MNREDGIVMVTLLVFLTLMAIAAALEFPSLLGDTNRRRVGDGEYRVKQLAFGAEEAYRVSGRYPASLDQWVGVANLALGERKDPFSPAQDLSYRDLGDRLEVRARGLDGQLVTADDVAELRDNRVPGRSLTRNRLRILRALAYRSDYLSPKTLTSAERIEIRDRLRIRALAMRRRIYVGRSDAKILDKSIQDQEKALRKLIKKHRKGKTYNRATGSNGLLRYLGLSDTRAGDGFGRDLLADDFGFSCAGRDGRKNSNDDF